MKNAIVGTWISDPSDETTQKNFGNSIMEFKANGELIYSIVENNKLQQAFMVYEVADNRIITDQPSHPQREVTEFKIDNEKLFLLYDSVTAIYIRE